LLGGEYQPEARVTTGALTRLCAAQYRADKCFVGVDGFTEDEGFWGADLARVDAARALAERAAHVAVLTESTKFLHAGAAWLMDARQVSRVYTDDGLSPGAEASLDARGIEVFKVAKSLEG
jgi:DeoR/GlpR family transcriptional regulator of sugar metabolism